MITTAPGPRSGPLSHADGREVHKGMALLVLAISQLMVVLDATIVNIALPSAQADLDISNADRQWMVTAYTLAFGALLLLGGRIADYTGRKRIFIVGLIGFAAASAIGGLAPNQELLFGARALQGAFAALMAPASLAIVTVTFTEPKERATAFGVFGTPAAAAAGLTRCWAGLDFGFLPRACLPLLPRASMGCLHVQLHVQLHVHLHVQPLLFSSCDACSLFLPGHI